MTIVTVQFPTPRSGAIPTGGGIDQQMYRGAVQTVQENVMKTRVYNVGADSGTQSDVEIVTPFATVVGGFAKGVAGNVFVPVTILPKAGAPGTAVIAGLPNSAVYIITIYGR